MGGPPVPPPGAPPGRPPPPPGRPRPPPGPPGRPPRVGAPPTCADCCLGIIAGLGRGMPGAPPPGRGMRSLGAASRRGAPGAAGPPSGRFGRRCCVPMPCEGAKGLLPGRGPLGRRAGPGVGPPGRDGAGRAEELFPPSLRGVGAGLPAFGVLGRAAGAAGRLAGLGAGGFGPGIAPGLGAAVFGSWEAAGAAGLADGAGVTGLTGAAGTGGAGAASGAGFSATSAATAGVAGAGLAGAAGVGREASGLGSTFGFSPSVSRILRTTGDSRVEEGPRTYSPISLSLLSSSLLVIPTSFAISWTRGLATTLLVTRPRPLARTYGLVVMLIGKYSSSGHER